MPIDFSPARWQKTRENYVRWWEGELDRPLIPVVVSGRDPGRRARLRRCWRRIPATTSPGRRKN